MTWIQTHSGRDVDLLLPRASTIYMGDIVHALARINRFTGHTIGELPYSVAVHSVHAYRIARKLEPKNPTAHLVTLLHDAAEAYTGDIGTPLQVALGLREANSPLRLMTARLERVIFTLVGLSPLQVAAAWPIVKKADLLALQGERLAYMSGCPRDWVVPQLRPEELLVPVPRPLGPAAGERLFVKAYETAVKAWRGRLPATLRKAG